MEYNLPSEIVKDLNFGDEAKNRVISGVNKLAKAVNLTQTMFIDKVWNYDDKFKKLS